MIMKDLQLIDDDLVIDTDDPAIISDVDLLVQDIYNQIRIFHYSWALDFMYGSHITEYVNMPDEPIKLVEMKNDIVAVLRRDSRIVKDSWQIEIADDSISVKFLPVGRKDPVTLTLEVQ